MLEHGSRTDGSRATRDLGLTYTLTDAGLPRALAWYWEHGLLKQRPRFLDSAVPSALS